MVGERMKFIETGYICSEWDDDIVSNIANTSSGGTPSRSVAQYYDGDIKWLTTSELRDNTISDSIEHISESALKNSSAKLFPKDTVLMAMYGATIGRLGILATEASTNQACCALMCNPKKYDYKYLFYVLQGMREYIISLGSGAGQPNISQNIVKNLRVALPKLEEQRTIASALSDMDNLIDNLGKLIEKKKNVKRGAMQELLSGKRRLPGYEGAIAYKPISSLCSTFCDGDWIESKDQSTSGIRLVQTGNVGNGKFLNKSDKKRFVSEETFEGLHCEEIFEGDVLVSRLPDPAGRACRIPKNQERMITAVDCTIIRFADYNPDLFVAYTQTDEYKSAVATTMAGSTRQRISRSDLGRIEIPVFPSKEEQDELASFFVDMDKEIEIQEQKLLKLINAKKGMMQKLLTGEIRLV